MKTRRTAGSRRHAWSVAPVASGTVLLVMLAAVAAPATAAPSPGVPDPGSRPIPVGPLVLPGGSAAPSPQPSASQGRSNDDMVAAQIEAKQVQYSQTAQQLQVLDADVIKAKNDRVSAEARLRLAERETAAAVADSADSASAQFKEAARLPPGVIGSPLQDLSRLSRLQRGEGSGEMSAAGLRLSRARTAEQAAAADHRSALEREQAVSAQYRQTHAMYRDQEAALRRLRQQNAAAVRRLEQQVEARERPLAPPNINETGNGVGTAAHPDALQAVKFALSQLGDPYVWAAEGPDSYDCSGLMWAAYRSVGRTLPRVSRDQYYGTRNRPVDRDSLLPGDLVFYSTSSRWQDIYHVGMYIGGGRMVYAPTFGDVVKTGSVRWSSYFAATRVIGAVDAPKTPATSRPIPKPSQTSVGPRPSSPSTPSPTQTASPTGTPSQPPTSTPSGSPPTVSPSPSSSSPGSTPPSVSSSASTAPPTSSGAGPSATRSAPTGG
jgi:cell wall-associated NlpC family hydrolase